MLVSVQEMTSAAVPPIETEGRPTFWLAPNPLPFNVTKPYTGEEGGVMLVMIGLNAVNNVVALLAIEVVTTTGSAPAGIVLGTTATIDVLLQLVIDAAGTPLKVTVLVPCVAPKSVPVIVTLVPTPPEFGERLMTLGIAPEVIETLSKVAVASVELSRLATARPM
jgi:hypothetical protein